MQENIENEKSIQDKLATIKYNCDSETHLILNQEKCVNCKEKTCTFICPANVYSSDGASGKIVVQYENCLECGACRISCPNGAIEWHYPKAGHGVVLKHS